MKVLSFSLYGDNKIYTIGCIRNAELHKQFFNDWEMRVYHNNTVPQTILDELIKLGVKLINTNDDSGFINSLWRFDPIMDPDVEYFISRDCDSRISERDVISVNEWIESGKSFHIIREHPIGHGWLINAGMWGAKGGSINNYKEIFNNYISQNHRVGDKSIDQCFLRDIIHPIASKDLFLHDEYFQYEGYGESIKRDRALDNFAFIGESIDENDLPRGDQRSPIINLYNNGR
jgi:protein O-GlcNAc transferase